MYISTRVRPLVCLYCIPMSVTCPSPFLFFYDQKDLAENVLCIIRKHQQADAGYADSFICQYFL